jgi:hypothetical protein
MQKDKKWKLNMQTHKKIKTQLEKSTTELEKSAQDLKFLNEKLDLDIEEELEKEFRWMLDKARKKTYQVEKTIWRAYTEGFKRGMRFKNKVKL